MDGLGPIDIRIIIDNPSLLTSLRQSESSVQSSVGRMQAGANAASASVTSAVASNVASVAGSTGVMIERLKIQLAQLQAQRDLTSSGNAGRLIALNQQIDATQTQINRMSNAGRAGFDAMGNAVARSTNMVGTAWGAIRKLAYVLPGVGIAGIIAFATGPIIEYISKLDIFKGKLDQATANLKALNEVNKEAAKDAGKQIANLQILYKAATDVNNSMSDRVRYAEQIRATYPQSFANSTAQAILNGKEAKSYDELSKSIVAQAKAKAVADKEAALGATIVEAQFQKAKIASARQSKIDKVYSGEGRSNASIASNDSYIGVINYDAEKATKAQDDIINLANKQLKFVQDFAGGSAKVADTITKNTNLIQQPLKNFDALVNKITQKADIDNIKAALEAKMKSLAPNDKQLADYRVALTKLAEIEKAYNPKTDGNNLKTDNSEQQTALKAKRAALDKIASLEKEYDRKALNANDEQIQAIKDRFSTFRNEITKANDLVTKANAKIKDPKKRVSIIDVSILDPIEKTATDNEFAKQAVAGTEKAISEQKQLYQEYEAFKTEFGEQKAQERFGKDIGEYKTYLAYLKSLQPPTIDLQSSDTLIKAKATALSDLLNNKLIPQAEKEAASRSFAEVQKNLKRILDATQGASAERLRIETQYNEDVSTLQKNYTGQDLADRLAKLKYFHDVAMDGTKTLAFQESEIYKVATQDLFNISKDGLIKHLNQLKNLLKTFNGTPAQKQVLVSGIKNTENLLGTDQYGQYVDPVGDPEKYQKIARFASAAASSFHELGSSLSGISPDLSLMLNTMGDLSNIASNAASSISSFASGDVVGGIQGAVSALSGVFSLFSSAKQDAEQRAYAYDLQLKAVEAVNKALERQVALTKELYGTARLESYKKDLLDIAQAQQDAAGKLSGLLTLSGNKVFDEQITKLNKGEKINELVYGLWVEAYKKGGTALGQTIDLTTQSLEQLTKLMDEGKLDDKTAAIVQSMISLEQQAKDTANALKEEVTGTSFDALKDSITSLFESGEASAVNLGKALEKAIDSAILNSFERTQVEKAMQPFFDAIYAAGLDGNYTDTEIAALRAQKEEISKNLEKQADAYKAIVGIDPNEEAKDASTLSGAIKGITAEQANVLEGTTRGIQLQGERKIQLMSEQLGESRRQTLVQIEIAANTKRTADNTDLMRDSLKSIDKNTADSTGAILRGAGIV